MIDGNIEIIGNVCEVVTGEYCTTFRTRDIGISAGHQIAILHSMLIERDQRLAAAEAERDECRRLLLEAFGDSVVCAEMGRNWTLAARAAGGGDESLR